MLRISDLNRGGLLTILDAAKRFKQAPMSKLGLLEGETVVLYFNKPSTRTRISFETAIARLGGVPLSVGPRELQLDRGESIEDTARVISAYARAFVIRTFSDDDVRRFAAHSSIPVINALTDRHHPCQVLGDLMTMQEIWGELRGRRLTYVGDGDNVANSLIEGCALLGVDITIATPEGYEPDIGVVKSAREIASTSGARIELMQDPIKAVQGADAVYTDVWLSMGVPDDERQKRMRDFAPFQVNASLMARAQPDAVFMHCLPAHRGEEVTDEVIDGPQSRVLPQAANRLPTEQALLWALITGALHE
ncbi:MAG TPA: ornithine carbamoyltransferase [Candidatus Dormibacteraeota bacterium]|nr:ornithine carbamoyltransferase [Candidatus Dormibacteraeota bacterium]